MSTNGLTGRDLRNAILFGALVYLAMKFIGEIADVILIFSIIALLVVSLNPVVTFLHKHKIPRPVSTGLLALGTVALLVMMLYFIVPLAGRQLADVWRELPTALNKAQGWIAHLADGYPTLAPLAKSMPSAENLAEYGKPLFGGVSRLTQSAVSLVAAVLLVFVSTVYSLNNPGRLMNGFIQAISPVYRQRAKDAGARLATQVRAWSLGVVISMLLIFALTWLSLSLLGLKQAFLFAVIAGLLEAVPVIGPILGGVMPTLAALMQDPILALWVVGIFVFIQQIENHILIPQVMSRSLSLHPVTVIFWVLVMGGLFGIVGIFLATPAAVTAGVLYDELYLRGYREQAEDEASEQE